MNRDVYFHKMDHLAHLDDAFMRTIRERCNKNGNHGVHTLGSVNNYPIFDEFKRAGQAAMKLYFPTAEVYDGWGVMVMPEGESDWHDHKTTDVVLVYYPDDHNAKLKIFKENTIDVSPRRGLAVMYRGNAPHKITQTHRTRYSLVLLAREKRR